MDAAAITAFGTGALASTAAIAAVALDRFRKVAASSVALGAGLMPWAFLAIWNGWFRGSPAVSMIGLFGLFGSGPLFLAAFFLYGLGTVTPRRGIAAGASLIGMFAGIAFSTSLINLLSRME